MAFLLASASGLSAGDAVPESAFQDFWNAGSRAQQEAAIAGIVASEPDFNAVLRRLQDGRSYSQNVETGRLIRVRKKRFYYTVLVPDSYDPERRYPARVYLHGGVERPAFRKDGSWWRRYDEMKSPDRIAVFPASWNEAMWWQESQAENLAGILRELKRTYNLDENRVHMIGISDGATGAYFQAFRAATPWAGFLPFIGHPAVLGNARGVDGQMYIPNLSNRPFFIVNGELDRLYPTRSLVPWLQLFERQGVELVFRNQPDSGHGVSWWPSEVERINAFIASHPRDPLPDRLVWETERTDRYHRFHWLLITELGSAPGESELADANSLTPPPPVPSLGLVPDSSSGSGVRVREVRPRSVASSAGLKTGDVLVELAGVATPTVEDLGQALADHAGFGETLTVFVERKGKRLEKTLRFPAEPEAAPPVQAFPRPEPSGRVELERHDNHVVVRTRGVRRFKLLLSPLQFDFDRPLTVTTNGAESFHGRIVANVATLLEWAAEDQDRTMLFGAQLEIRVGRAGPSSPPQGSGR